MSVSRGSKACRLVCFDYAALITETPDDLALIDTLGYSERQLHRWFDAYRAGGLDALLRYDSTGGSTERVAPSRSLRPRPR